MDTKLGYQWTLALFIIWPVFLLMMAVMFAIILVAFVIAWPFLLFGRVKIKAADGKMTLTPFDW